MKKLNMHVSLPLISLLMLSLFCCIVQAGMKRQSIDLKYAGSISIDDKHAIIGCPNENNMGAVYFLKKNDLNEWVEVGHFFASDSQENSSFGYSVAVSNEYAFVGAPAQDVGTKNSIIDGGAVYIFKFNRSSGIWSELKKITAPDAHNGMQYGYSVSSQGLHAIVGAPFCSSGGLGFAGTAYILSYDKYEDKWREQSQIFASDRAPGDLFGAAVSISGKYALVGAPFEDGHNADPFGAGAAYIFELNWTNYPNTWDEKIKFNATATYQYCGFFGQSVSISGNTAIVGSPGSVENTFDGAAYIYERNIKGKWIESKIVSAKNELDAFGASVYINGNYAIVGAPHADAPGLEDSGEAYLYSRSGNGEWNYHKTIIPEVKRAYDRFGLATTIYGNTDIVLAPGFNNEAGSIHFFEEPSLKYDIRQVTSTNPDGADNPNYLFIYNDKLFYSASNHSGHFKLFSYDDHSVVSNPRQITDLNINGHDAPRNLTIYNDKLYFTANATNGVRKLFCYDDHTGSLIQINETNTNGSDGPESLIVYNNKLFYSSLNNDWYSKFYYYDDSSGLVAQMEETNPDGNDQPSSYLVFDNKLYYSSKYRISVYYAPKVFIEYDGNAMTYIKRGSNYVHAPSICKVYNNKLFFTAYLSGSNYLHSYKNGLGVDLITHFDGFEFIVYNNKLFFTYGGSIHSYNDITGELIKVSNFNYKNNDYAEQFSVFRNKLIFKATYGSGYKEKLYSFSEITESFVQITDMIHGLNRYVTPRIEYDNNIFFAMEKEYGEYNNRLYCYDEKFISIVPETSITDSDNPKHLTLYNGKLFYSSVDNSGNQKLFMLWR